MSGTGDPIRVVVLISGSGTNLQSILDDATGENAPYRVAGVISNRGEAKGLERARRAGVPTRVVSHREYSDREAFDRTLAAVIDEFAPNLVVLAGFMRVLTPAFTERYAGRMLNVHPSLLPDYRGLNTHQRVLADGAPEHGTSIHFVTTELDGGPVVLQGKLPVRADDTPESLRKRIQSLEHRIFPLVIRWFAEGRLALTPEGATLDGTLLTAPLRYDPAIGRVEPPS